MGIIMIILVLSCKKDNESIRIIEQNYFPEEVYSVYGAILYPLSSINIVVSTTDTSLNCSSALLMNMDTVGVTQVIVEQCIAINKQEYMFAEAKLQSAGLKLVSWNEITASASAVDVYQKYGANGMYRFGVPVFFNNGNSAMFEYDHNCGPLCGNGAIIIAKKINGSWGIAYNYLTWISK